MTIRDGIVSLLASFLATMGSATGAQEACGNPAAGFSAAGADGPVSEFVLFDDGSGPALYAAGGFGTVGDVCASGIARWDGSTWSPVGTGLQGTVLELKVLDVGASPSLHALVRTPPWGGTYVARWDGTSWVTVTGTFGSNFSVRALATCVVASTSQIVVGGTAETIEGSFIPTLYRWNGTSWVLIADGPATSIGPWGVPNNGSIEALATYDDGSGVKLYAAGTFDRVGGQGCYPIVRWDGSTWSQLAVSPGTSVGHISGLAVHDDGAGARLYISSYPPASSPAIAWNGITVALVGSGMSGAVESLFTSTSSIFGRPAGLWGVGTLGSQNGLFHWNGASWSFDALPTLAQYTFTYGLGVFDDGSGADMFVGGDFLFSAPNRVQNLARWSGTAYEPITTTPAPAVLARPGGSYSARVEGLGLHDFGSGPEVVAGGTFTHAGDVPSVRQIARFDGTTWRALNSFLSGGSVPRAFTSFGGQLWVAGELYPGGSGLEPFLRWVGTHFEVPDISDGMGRGFATLDTGGGPVLYGLTDRTLRRWTGSDMVETNTNFVGIWLNAIASFDDGSGPQVYVGGTFTTISGIATTGIARYDGSAWSAVGAGITGTVEALTVHDDGAGPRLVAGGTFTSSGGTPLANIAQWTGTQWIAVGTGVGGSVFALASIDDGLGEGRVLLAGGTFATAGGSAAANLARWNGTSWSEAFGGSNGLNPSVRAFLEVDHDAHGGHALYVGGDFSSIGGLPSTRFARIELCPELGETFCHGDGSEGPCPCANESTLGARSGCMNSLGTAGTMRARGRASLAADTLALDGAGMPNSSVLYFQAGSSHAPTAFGDGLKCTGGPFVRLGTKNNSAGASSYPLVGDPSISVRGFVVAAGTRHYQARYRNSANFCGPDTFNYTNAVTIRWSP